MKKYPLFSPYRLLTGSLCVWLLCAWVAQQPAPAHRIRSAVQKNAPATRSANAHSAGKGAKASGEIVKTSKADSTVQHDPESGLAIDKTMPLVKGQCTACHSSKLILQSHFDREKWIERIRWMQRTQKLWDLGESEPAILTYLTKYYGPLDTPFDGRRLPLPAPSWYKQAER